MLTLYVKTNCPYSARVREKVEALGILIEEKDIEDPAIADELLAKGGKLQTPYLVDDERDVALYESMDIIAHLRRHYGRSEEETIRFHRGGADVCE